MYHPPIPIAHAMAPHPPRPLPCIHPHPPPTQQDPTGEAAAAAEKHLTYYELDLGLNHVVRKWSDPVDNGANLLIPVPGGGDGPGGVLVCAENFVLYKHQGHEEVGSWCSLLAALCT
jgi:hypothetical protein